MYDYYLGGKDNYAADRAAAEQVIAQAPEVPLMARENRAFLGRAVRFLAAERGIGQFLDIGTGIPAADNTHEVAQRADPAARVVYVDNDPIVLTHARALLATDDRTQVVDGDFREPDKILGQAREFLDFGAPVAIVLLAVLHFIPDDDDPYTVDQTQQDAVPSGSHLVISHVEMAPGVEAASKTRDPRVKARGAPRTRAQVAAFFDGLELVDPGVVAAPLWRPAGDRPPAVRRNLPILCAVGRKP
jgi:hypothetical protein